MPHQRRPSINWLFYIFVLDILRSSTSRTFICNNPNHDLI